MSKFKFIDQKDQIINWFLEGKKYIEIANLLNSTNPKRDAGNIRRLIISELHPTTHNNQGVIKGYESEILELINEGYTPIKIGEMLSINPITISSWIRVHHPEIHFRPNKGNVNYFKNIDSYAKAYIVGFIAADGALVKCTSSDTYSLTITIKYEDKAVLEFIKSEIGNSHKLMEIIKPSSFDKTKNIHHIRYCITDKNISNDLLKLGIENNKSLTMGNIIENIPYKYRDAFVIGYFDGDGSVHIEEGTRKMAHGIYPDHSLYINIRGTKAFLEGICNHLNISKTRIYQHDSIPSLSFASKKDTYRLFQCYKNLPFYYKRKYDIFLKRINHPSYDKYKQVQTISSSE